MKNLKRKNTKLLLVILILGISIGFALLSKNLGINGISGINKNTWDIHWDDTSVHETEGSVSATTPAYVSDTEKKHISFDVELELPGDFYEFTADAKNYGTIDGAVDEIQVKVYEEGSDEPIDPADLPEDIIYSFTYADGSPIQSGDRLKVGESISYKFRIEYDSDSTNLLDDDDKKPKTIDIVVPVNQPLPEDTTTPYKITFNPNGGIVDPTIMEVTRGEKIGTLPVPTKDDTPFLGWYTGLTDGTRVTINTIPTGNTTYYAHWADSYTMFDTGSAVNAKFKSLAGNTNATSSTADSNITSIVRSDTAPVDGTTTEIVSAEDYETIYAWFDNGTIKWYTPATTAFLNPDANSMFYNMTALSSLDMSFNTNKVTGISGMFQNDTSLTTLDLSSWDTSNLIYMNGTFQNCSYLSTINFDNWDTSNVTAMSGLFSGCNRLIGLDLSGFDISNVTSLSSAFSGCYSMRSLNISGWNFDKCQYLSGLFSGLSNLETINLENVQTSNVTSMASMFTGCNSLTVLDLTSFDTRKVTDMSSMFAGSSNLVTITVSDYFLTRKVTSSSSMFGGCVSIVGGLGTTYDGAHIDKLYARYDRAELKPGYFNAGNVTYNTVTFNPNGGEVTPTELQVIEGGVIKNMPTPTRTGMDFRGWYTEISGGTRVTSNTVITGDITLYAHWYSDVSVTYNANGGSFENNDSTRTINYGYGSAPVTKYSHTSNIDDTGVATAYYGASLTVNDVVSIPGAETLNIEVWYSTEGDSWDWLAIYPAGVTPDQSNYSQATISGGKLGGHGSYSGYTKPNDEDTTYHRTFVVNGDTAQFFFRSDGGGANYGYYAIITGTGKGYTGDIAYQQPTKTDSRFIGWNTKADGTGKTFNTEKEVMDYIDESSNISTLYAEWEDTVTITFEGNGGTVQDNTTRTIIKGTSIGELPNAIRNTYSFTGWYLSEIDGVKITKDYVPDTNITVWAHWSGVEAVFDTGPAVNIKFKTLAGDELQETNPYTTMDENVTKIKKSTTEPTTENKSEEHIVSASDSQVPIYAWYDNGTIYWWSEANKVYTNSECAYMFYNFTKVTEIDTTFDTSITTGMYYMFAYLSSLPSIDVSNFNTSNVTNMGYMFYYDTSLTSLDLSSFDVRNVSNMSSMFYNDSSLDTLNLSNWNFKSYNPGNLTNNMGLYGSNSLKTLIMDNAVLPQNMYYGFGYLYGLSEISFENVDTSRVTDIRYLFYEDKSLVDVDLSDWDTRYVTSLYYMFDNCYALEHVTFGGKFNTSNVTDMQDMFYNCKSIVTLDLSSFDTKKVQYFSYMFYNMESLENLNLSNWNFSSYTSSSMASNMSIPNTVKRITFDNVVFPTNMYYAFADLVNLENITFNNVDSRKTTNMSYMFDDCDKIQELDLTSFDTKNVTNTGGMFYSMDDIRTIMVSDKFEVDQITSSSSMFYDDLKLVGGHGTKYDSSHIDVEYAHYDGGNIDPGYFDYKNVPTNTITLDPNGGTVSPDKVVIRQYRTAANLPIPYFKAHIFEGWYTLPGGQGVLVDENYTPPSDITGYATWRDAIPYTITFNGNGGTPSEESRIVYETEEIGELPTATMPNYKLVGWYTDITAGTKVYSTYVPTENITLYARWKIDFATADVDEIKRRAEETNKCQYFDVGDTREIELDGFGTHTIRIVNCSHQDYLDTNSTKSQTANGLVIEFADLITKHRINPYDKSLGFVNGNGVKGGWKYSEMRTYINNEIYNSLPQEWQDIIIDTRVVSGYTYATGDRSNFITTDKLYLFNPAEVFSSSQDSLNSMNMDTSDGATRQLDYYNSIRCNTWHGTPNCRPANKGYPAERYGLPYTQVGGQIYRSTYGTAVWSTSGVDENNGGFCGVNSYDMYSSPMQTYFIPGHETGWLSPAFRIGG